MGIALLKPTQIVGEAKLRHGYKDRESDIDLRVKKERS